MEESSGNSSIKTKLRHIYESQYKKLLVIPLAMLVISFVLIGIHFSQTGEFVNRDVSLKGGITITIPTTQEINTQDLEEKLSSEYQQNDVSAKAVAQLGSQVAIIVDSDIDAEQIDAFVASIGKNIGKQLTKEDYSIEVVGPSLGQSFFKELLIALGIAFVFMAFVVFIQFRSIIPSLAVIISAFCGMVNALAIINLLDIKISGAGIAAFLMLIGYSVDANILLSNRVLKRKEGTEMERIYGSISTGLKITATAICALIAGLIFSHSEVIRQIMLILLIGLVADIVNTWIGNVGILRMYLERKRQ